MLILAERHIPGIIFKLDPQLNRLSLDAFFLQAVWICDVQGDSIQLIKDQVHPVVVAQAHHCRIEKKHISEGIGHHHALCGPQEKP